MITELFLNSCFSLVLNKTTKIRRTKVIYRDIIEILTFFKIKQKNEIPVYIQNKIDCLETICKLKLDDKVDDNIIDSISFGEKFKLLLDFLKLKRDEEINEEILSDHITQIRMRKKLNNVVSNYDQISKFLDIIKSGNFNSIDEVIYNYEKIIKEANFNLMEAGRSVAIESCSTLDLVNDDYTPVINMIKTKYDKDNTVSSGYSIFDRDVFMNGGFEKSRLYVFGGGSGSGKSTLMLNFFNNDICKPLDKNLKNKSFVYLYITLENQIDESLFRLYQMMFEKTAITVLRDINSGIDIKKEVLDKIKKSGYNLIFKYFPKYSISCTDIMSHLDDIEDKYGKGSIRGLCVDYIDLLKSDISNELYRLELGFITAGLKDIAVKYNIPILTPTQLNRGVYKNQESRTLNLDMMGESMKKVDHADFICLMSKDSTSQDKVHLKVGKNRCGRDNVSIDFTVNFEHYKFLDGLQVSNEKRSDVTTDQLFDLSGIKESGGKNKKTIQSFSGFIEEKMEKISNGVF